MSWVGPARWDNDDPPSGVVPMGQERVVIDHMQGYFPGSARENLLRLRLLARQIALRKELRGRSWTIATCQGPRTSRPR